MYKFIRKSVVGLFVILSVASVQAATVKTISIPSEKMGIKIPVTLILPDSYKNSTQRFPVTFLLHGAGDSHAKWNRATKVAELSDKYGVIFLCPDGDKTSWYFDSPINPKSQYETFIAKECVEYLDKNYRTKANRDYRAICGASMGGHGALFLSIRNKDVFSVAVALSGGVDIRPYPNNWGIKKRIGNIKTHKENWEKYTVINLAKDLKDNELSISIDCGNKDFFLKVNRALHKQLEEDGITHAYIEMPGTHGWVYWAKAIKRQMPLIDKHFKKLNVKPTVAFKDEIINIFPDKPKNGVIGREQIGNKELWVSAVRKNGKTRQIRITSYIGGRGRSSLVKFRYPFGDASATWNMDVTRNKDIVSVMIPWNGTLIGDIMDVNEGDADTAKARKKLGLTDPDSTLPVMYSSGDSISMGYWPYLEAELHDKVNVYYQRELEKDNPNVVLKNNGHARLAYKVLQSAYKNADFQPDYLLVNFGLHMINTHKNKLPAYKEWVDKFIAYAKEKKVKLILVTTTPYLQSSRPTQNLVILKLNELMKASAKRRKIPVIDLHACVLDAVKELGAKKVFVDGVHFTEAVKKRQAAFIAEHVRKILAKGK